MPYHPYYIDVEKDEKQLYRIMRDLQKTGESLCENACTPEFNSACRKLGVRGQKLIKAKPPLLYPLFRTWNSKKSNVSLIKIPKNIIIEEKKGYIQRKNTITRFIFKRK